MLADLIEIGQGRAQFLRGGREGGREGRVSR